MGVQISLKRKVMIVSSWAPPSLGGPQNLYNIFCNFNENGFVIFTRGVNDLKEKKCSGSRLPCHYYFYDKNGNGRMVQNLSKDPFLNGLIGKMVRVIYKPYKFLKIIKNGLGIIKNEKINLLMGISDSGPSLFLTFVLSKLSGKSYVLYFFDLYKGNNIPRVWEILSFFFEPLLLKQAKKIIVTNEETKHYYFQRYKERVGLEVIYNSAFGDIYNSVKTPFKPKPPYSVVFTGRIYWAQERSIRNIIAAIEAIKDIEVHLNIYAPEPPQDLLYHYAKHPRIHFDVAPHVDMPAIQTKADILFLPLSWETPSPSIIATATPGKLTDYLISGRPILIHAPPYACVCQYARRYGVGHVVDEEKEENLIQGIKKLLFNGVYSQRLINNAQKTFYEHHDAVTNSKKMASILNEI